MNANIDKSNAKIAMLRGWFADAVHSHAYSEWQKEARECWDFYDGNQWSNDEIAALADVGQPAIVINKIAAKVDNLVGIEVSGRTRVVYRSRSGDPHDEATAEALTDVALYVAEQSEQSLALSHVFKDGLVCGIGWLDVGIDGHEGENPHIFCRAEDPLTVVWDPLSRLQDMSDSRFVARERWLDDMALEKLFGDKVSIIKGRLNDGNGMFAGVDSLSPRELVWYTLAADGGREVYRIVEMQYTEPCALYTVRRDDGRVMSSWQKPTAAMGKLENVSNQQRVRVAYFCGDVLLDDRWLGDGFDGFSLVPFVYRRQRKNGQPYGLVRAAMDPQREFNKRRSKAMHMLNTAQVIADVDAVEDPNVLAREAARPDGIILKRSGKDLRILRNTELAASQVAVMDSAARDIQEVIGVYDESIGKQSNAVSGVAIQQRQMAGSLSQMAAFDTLRVVKKRLGRTVLELIRQVFNHEMVTRIVDQMGASRLVKLNERVVGDDGKMTILHDVFAGDFDVVVEEVRDVMSARELEADKLNMLIKAGVPVPMKVLVEASGVRQKDAILAALKQ